MATGPEHFREAERLIRGAGTDHTDGKYYMDGDAPTLTAAMVHATLAHAAATAELATANGHSVADGQYSQPYLARDVSRSAAWSEAFNGNGEGL